MGNEVPTESTTTSHVTVDARGLSCPEPVIMTIKAIDAAGSGSSLEVLVDTATSRNNVLLAAQQRGWQGEYDEDVDGTFHVMLKK